MVAVNFLSIKIKIFFLLILVPVLSVRPTEERVKISLVGDIIINDNMVLPQKQPGPRNNIKRFDDFFSRITGTLAGSDLVIGNLESPVLFPGKTNRYLFNGPREIIPALKNAGFSILSIANNHILDQGPEGLLATVDALRFHGIRSIGAGPRSGKHAKGVIKNIRGIKTGIISYTGLLNVKPTGEKKNYYINWLYNRLQVNENIDYFRSQCDYLIMIVHSGKEYQCEPDEADKKILKHYINRGVDLIVRHHPHVLQPVERIIAIDGREGYIFYSLGNFISEKCREQNFFLISRGEVYNSTILLNLHLARNNGAVRSNFSIVPVVTVKRRCARGERYQTVTIKGVIDSIKSGAFLNKEESAGKDILKLKNKVLEIKKIIYKYQYLSSVKIEGYNQVLN